MNPSSCLFRFVWAETAIFYAKPRAPKMQESQQLFFGLRLVSRIFEEFLHPEIKTKIVQHFGRFFSNKSAPANRKKGFYTNCDPNKQEVVFIFV